MIEAVRDCRSLFFVILMGAFLGSALSADAVHGRTMSGVGQLGQCWLKNGGPYERAFHFQKFEYFNKHVGICIADGFWIHSLEFKIL